MQRLAQSLVFRAGDKDGCAQEATDERSRIRAELHAAERRLEEQHTPFVVPEFQPIELYFFQQVFDRLRSRDKNGPSLSESPAQEIRMSHRVTYTNSANLLRELRREVPLVTFQRAMVRLLRILGDDRQLDHRSVDTSANGFVGWYEFCSYWQKNQFQIRFSLAERVFLTLDDPGRSTVGKIASGLVFLFIFVSTLSFILSTLPGRQVPCPLDGEPGFDPACVPKPQSYFNTIDMVCVFFFTIEYGTRAFLSGFTRSELLDRDFSALLEWMVMDEVIHQPSYSQRLAAFVFHWANLIDLAAILPWYLSQGLPDTSGDENLFIRVIRLMRVIRAFRLGRRLEAIIVIIRSLRKSWPPLKVLVLNLVLFVIVFGPLMYFAEQGTWNEEVQAYERVDSFGEVWYSPFVSIPDCFWWAIVTSTTVGYGDRHTPKTTSGKVVASLSMIWSLGVLALPIGVIGGNFCQVWQEYDSEQLRNDEDRLFQELVLRKSLAWSDPLYYSRRLCIEVWHYSGLHGEDITVHSDFMGEIDTMLEVSPTEQIRNRRVRLPLRSNLEKARRTITDGWLTFDYSWFPCEHLCEGIVLQGRLEVTLVRADNLMRIDWGCGSVADPYCVVLSHPHCPTAEGDIDEVAMYSNVMVDTINPEWHQTLSIDMKWTEEGSKHGVLLSMATNLSPLSDRAKSLAHRKMRQRNSKKRTKSMSDRGKKINVKNMWPLRSKRVMADESAAPGYGKTRSSSKASRPRGLQGLVSQLEAEIKDLRGAMPGIYTELGDAKQDLHDILAALQRQDWPGIEPGMGTVHSAHGSDAAGPRVVPNAPRVLGLQAAPTRAAACNMPIAGSPFLVREDTPGGGDGGAVQAGSARAALGCDGAVGGERHGSAGCNEDG